MNILKAVVLFLLALGAIGCGGGGSECPDDAPLSCTSGTCCPRGFPYSCGNGFCYQSGCPAGSPEVGLCSFKSLIPADEEILPKYLSESDMQNATRVPERDPLSE